MALFSLCLCMSGNSCICCERNQPCLPLNTKLICMTNLASGSTKRQERCMRPNTHSHSAQGSRDKDIIDALNVSPSMVAETRQRYVEERPESALKDHSRPGRRQNSPISIQLISLQWPAAMRPLPNFFNGIPDLRRRSTISVLRCARYRR